ncbi:predicted protein [Sclerotinia sclerotiorum 1980 UF-70]|uniref:Uncharacterized protein n=1 Tax=Sclerotinia sclerotiorum (strain ATCC 18683 / 1980 / Ss-1) TaxID=665079 RepID=A7EF90_SCLS1|nr:predicted protein [Sclerotinia sclerotiorum 1980 UF-70]EDO01506.1 predicted protein [Sclerotinia sclerotiorum 1980 UF-70]
MEIKKCRQSMRGRVVERSRGRKSKRVGGCVDETRGSGWEWVGMGWE